MQDTNTGCAEELLVAAVEDAWHSVVPRSVEDLQRVIRGASDDADAKVGKGKRRPSGKGKRGARDMRHRSVPLD